MEKAADDNAILKEYLVNIVRYTPGFMYLKDPQFKYVLCNENFAKVAGLQSAEEVVGKTDYDLVWAKTQADLFKKGDLDALAGIKQLNVETPQLQSDGSTKIVLSNKVPLYDASRNIIGILGNYLDITDRKKMEEDLHQAKEASEAANYIMTEFISNMGHDLATPISDVGSVAEALRCYIDEYPELKDLIEILIQRSAACEAVRKRIINATAISNLEAHNEAFSVIDALLVLEKELRPFINTKKLNLTINPLKPKKEDIIITDRTKFHDILYDLISNAINFTEEGGISISVSKQNGLFHIKIMDTGIGIPEDKFEYIFKQYTKLARSNRYGAVFKGVGAGLYLARIRAHILNATINVESKVGGGSTFTVTIPARAGNMMNAG